MSIVLLLHATEIFFSVLSWMFLLRLWVELCQAVRQSIFILTLVSAATEKLFKSTFVVCTSSTCAGFGSHNYYSCPTSPKQNRIRDSDRLQSEAFEAAEKKPVSSSPSCEEYINKKTILWFDFNASRWIFCVHLFVLFGYLAPEKWEWSENVIRWTLCRREKCHEDERN